MKGRCHLKESEITRNPITDAEIDDVAGDQLACQERLQFAIADTGKKGNTIHYTGNLHAWITKLHLYNMTPVQHNTCNMCHICHMCCVLPELCYMCRML